MSILPHINDFLLHIKANNYSPKTLYNYERDLDAFANFLEEQFKVTFDNINKNTIEQYKVYLSSPTRKTSGGAESEVKLKSGSINRHLGSLRRYLGFLMDMDYPTPVGPHVIKFLRNHKTSVQLLEFKEVLKLIECPTTLENDEFVAARNRALLETLIASGMRISELISLKINQFTDGGKIYISGKGHTDRFIYLTARAEGYIRAYLKMRDDDCPYIFVARRGLNAKDIKKHISANYLQMKIKRYRELLGISIPTSAHSLRHGFATYLAEQGANPAAIQVLLGHESLETTSRYVHASDRYAETTHRDFHPLK